jgi:hypothetical protein
MSPVFDQPLYFSLSYCGVARNPDVTHAAMNFFL